MNDDASLMVSPSLVKRLQGIEQSKDQGSNEVIGLRPTQTAQCLISGARKCISGTLVSYDDLIKCETTGFAVTISIDPKALRDALEICEIEKVVISIDGIPVISRAVPNEWTLRKEIRPCDTKILFMLSCSKRDI